MLKRLILLIALAGLTPVAVRASLPLAEAEPTARTTERAAASETAEEKATGPLMPDPTSAETWRQAMWSIAIFLLLVVILYPTAWKSVLAGLKAREDRIRKDISDADAARLRAEASLKDYTAQLATAEGKVREMIAKATSDAEAIAQNVRVRAQQEAEEAKERAQRDIEAARDQALAQLHEEAVNLATTIAEKIIRRNLNPNDQRDLLASSLDELQMVGSR